MLSGDSSLYTRAKTRHIYAKSRLAEHTRRNSQHATRSRNTRQETKTRLSRRANGQGPSQRRPQGRRTQRPDGRHTHTPHRTRVRSKTRAHIMLSHRGRTAQDPLFSRNRELFRLSTCICTSTRCTAQPIGCEPSSTQGAQSRAASRSASSKRASLRSAYS